MKTKYPTGEDHGKSKLTEKQVLQIRGDRERCPEVYSFRRLAMQYDVSVGCIYNVITRRTWNDLHSEDRGERKIE